MVWLTSNKNRQLPSVENRHQLAFGLRTGVGVAPAPHQHHESKPQARPHPKARCHPPTPGGSAKYYGPDVQVVQVNYCPSLSGYRHGVREFGVTNNAFGEFWQSRNLKRFAVHHLYPRNLTKIEFVSRTTSTNLGITSPGNAGQNLQTLGRRVSKVLIIHRIGSSWLVHNGSWMFMVKNG